jgi:hypothetical protein
MSATSFIARESDDACPNRSPFRPDKRRHKHFGLQSRYFVQRQESSPSGLVKLYREKARLAHPNQAKKTEPICSSGSRSFERLIDFCDTVRLII